MNQTMISGVNQNNGRNTTMEKVFGWSSYSSCNSIGSSSIRSVWYIMGDGSKSSTDDSVDIQFSTTSNSFSIRCGKCADIHNAQIDGKTNKACECDCHSQYQQPYVPYVPCVPDPCCPQFPTYYTTTITAGETTCMVGVETPRRQDGVYGVFDYHLAGIIDG